MRTDYEGLGTPRTHPFLVGFSEGRSVLDMARAARAVTRGLSRQVIVAGHSQGGHAALRAASLAARWTPELRVRGTVAFAPASHIGEQSGLLPGLTTPGKGLSGLIALIVRGVDTQRPALHASRYLTSRARALYSQTLSRCLPELSRASSFGGIPPSEIFRKTDLSPVLRAIAGNDPEDLRIPTAVRVEQGGDDHTVLPAFTDQLVSELRGRGVAVSQVNYPGVDHGGIVTAGATDATNWIRGRLRG